MYARMAVCAFVHVHASTRWGSDMLFRRFIHITPPPARPPPTGGLSVSPSLRLSVSLSVSLALALLLVGLVSYGKTKGIVTQAYSPLGNGKLPGDGALATIGQKHGKSGAQVALKWLVQKGMSVSTKANSSVYLAEDIDVFDWSLDADQVAELDADTDYPGSPCWACSK